MVIHMSKILRLGSYVVIKIQDFNLAGYLIQENPPTVNMGIWGPTKVRLKEIEEEEFNFIIPFTSVRTKWRGVPI